ncbi:bifunctional glutamate N-acetyltransferase/amino-acid acetyltransferase ArgJ [Rhodospirillaceae bacterium KN72]|uniref:Arginine biosynthesis bifunctional protein ArgJ n=1 Tax=Pacificispira spongiicola TaxID=2729598 RepID=A0A7Y0E109_9PROT|nr:bifunctional glutamate N-acetyltransferase/amino-acid acetyltransferase ArgJ [Pacificispira spongiicola]NMM45272.1 bifunctional glutamate N-acetyltransferase/amino-acid acetyltransferase ArgJ [Pacificispira spongiicola]
MSATPSPFAPKSFPDLPVIDGVRIGSIAAGVKYQNRPDLFMAEMADGTAVAGVLTKSLTRSSAVEWCAKVIKHGTGRAMLVNAGNANAFTGKAGMEGTEHMAAAAAAAVGCKKKEVLVASTGVIGMRLPADRISVAVPALHAGLKPESWEAAARAIMTTDTFPKGAGAECEIDGIPVKIAGIAKGSGMIAPDMATMLSFVFTDANIPSDVLQQLLTKGADKSFNSITVDGDTSTSDTLLLAATGKAGNKAPKKASDKSLADFKEALDKVLTDLAHQVVKDGEGASKFVTIDITGAASDKAARRIGLSIANSPLVKTAIAGEDANWGRIVMAVGKAGEKADRDRLTVSMGGVLIVEKGEGVQGYDEAPVTKHLKGREIDIAVDIGIGKGKARVWTCDLTHAYIDINADYRS